MKIARNIKVVLKDSEGDATFSFTQPKLNEIQREATELKGIEDPITRITKELEFAFARLTSVTGLKDEDGAELGVDFVKSMALPINLMVAINGAYVEGYTKSIKGKEPEPEKKD